MSSFSWLFGKKKSGAEGPITTVSSKTYEESEGFQIVHPSQLYPILDGETTSGDAVNLPYGVTATAESTSNKQSPSGDWTPYNPIQDVPFKLKSHSDVTELEVFLFNVQAALRKTVHVNENVIKYNFSTERSVLNEENCVNSNFS